MTERNHAATRRPPEDASDPPTPFLFVGDALALDLVNTEIVVRRKAIDLLASPDAYAAWWRAAVEHFPDLADRLPASAIAANPALLPTAVSLRGALRAVFSAVADGTPAPADALAVLNQTLRAVDNAVVLGTASEPRPLLVPQAPDADGPLAAVAQSAFELLTGADASRLHRCANGRCVLLFYDTTRSATRRWCSTACMNRARSSRRHRERQQAAAAGEMALPPPPLP